MESKEYLGAYDRRRRLTSIMGSNDDGYGDRIGSAAYVYVCITEKNKAVIIKHSS